MKINYEALFWVMFVVNIVGLVYLISSVRAVNNLVMEIGVLRKRLDNSSEDILNSVEAANARLDDVMEALEDAMEDEIEEEEWEPEPDEDLEPGEVVTRGELPIEIDEDPIHLITPNQFFFEQGHDKFELEYDSVGDNLYYYYGPENDEKVITIANVDECISEGLKYFGVRSENDHFVYVRNNIFHADFRIRKVS